MDPILVGQIISLIQWALTGALQFKENDAFVGTVIPALQAALSENRPLTDAEWAPIHAAAQQANDDLQNA